MRLVALIFATVVFAAPHVSAAEIQGKEGDWHVVASNDTAVTMFFTGGKSRPKCNEQARAFSKDNEGHVVNGRKLGKLMAVAPEQDGNWSKGCVAFYNLEVSK